MTNFFELYRQGDRVQFTRETVRGGIVLNHDGRMLHALDKKEMLFARVVINGRYDDWYEYVDQTLLVSRKARR